jgi:electron transfer flavoprotein beta subunit
MKAGMPEASAEEVLTAVDRRTKELRERGLVIEQWDLEQIGADLQRCGLAGSPTKVYRVQSIVLTKEGYTEVPPTEDGARQLIHELVVDRTLG